MKLNIKFFIISSLLLCTGCELDYAPENQLVDEKVYKTERTAQAALMGCYVRLNVFLSGGPQDQNNYSNTGYTLMYADMGTDNLNARSNIDTYVAMENASYNTNEHDGLLSSIWNWGYNAIDFTNNLIIGIDKYAQFSENKRNQYIAEAKFIRAYVYFQLLCMFGDQALLGNDSGDGVVMRLNPYNGYNPDEAQGRETNATCWTQIINDFQEAIADLPDEIPAAGDRIRANKTVAKALLSRVYLYKGSYAGNHDDLKAACDLSAEVLSDPGYTFNTAPSEFSSALFPSNEYTQSGSYPDPSGRSEEVLFFEPSRISTAAYPNGLYFYRKTTCYVPQEMLQVFDENDVRRTELIWTGSKSDHPSDMTTKKYSADNYCDVLYIRLSEIKLTFAETLARTSGSVSEEAVKQLNDVYLRAFDYNHRPQAYTTGDFVDAEALIARILLERRRELAYEGHYRWDIVRTGNAINDSKMGAVDKSRWNMPVPDYEIRISYGAITQNSGYR